MKNRINSFMSNCNKRIKLILLISMLFSLTIGQMRAWWWVPGTIHNNGVFNSTLTEGKDGGIFQMPEGNTITFYNVPAGTNEFKLVKGSDWGHGNFTNKSTSTITTLCSNCSNGNNKIITNAAADITFTITNETDWNCDVTASSPTYYIKYNWGNDGWAWSGALISNGGNMYSCNGAYSGNGSYDHTRLSSTDADGTNTTATVKNSPSEDDNCLFEYNASTKALTITRCNHVNNGNHIYFDNSVSNFTGNIYLVIGHDKPTAYSKVYQLTQVTGTKLYHIDFNTDTWSDVTYYAIIASSSNASTLNGDYKWGSSSLSTKGNNGYTATYTSNYDLNGTSGSYKTFLITTAVAGNNKAMTITYYDGYSNLPKVNAIQSAKKRDTGTAYSNVSGTYPANLKLQGSHMNTASAIARNTITSTTSTDGAVNTTYSAIKTGLITHSIASLSAGYYHEGWGVGSETSPSKTTATYEYNITAATTVYAFFSKLYTLSYATKGDDTGSSVSVYSVDGFSGSTTSGSSIPTGHLITIVATPATGYEVKGWYSDTSCETAYTNGSGGVTIEDGGNTFKLASLNANSGVYPKFGPKNYTINLENMEATTPGTTSVSVTYNASTNMTASDPITKPTKDGYTFGGYYTSENTGATLDDQLIDADGKWIADVTDYTSHDGSDDPTWVHDYAISLYAMWTEDTHSVNVAVSPAGAGSVQVNSSNVTSVSGVGIATQSAEMTPIAAAGWKFKEWQVTSNVQMDLTNYHSDYQQGTANKMRINATADDQTITAVFEPRYYLVGKIWNDSDDGGMPGWSNYNKPFKVVTTSPVSDTCKLTLSINSSFYIMVRDKADGFSYGKADSHLGDGDALAFTDKDNKVMFYSNGGTEYTFKITAIDGSGRPTVSVERPYQVNVGRKRVDIDGADHDDNTGGTAAMSLTSGGDAVANGAWVPYGTGVTYTASPATGYTLAWYSASDYSGESFSSSNTFYHTATSTGNGYAKFTEKYTTVTINTNNSAGGSITVGGSAFTWGNTKTAGVTTKRALVVSTNTGYNFTGWALSSTPDFELQDKASDTDKEVTLAGLGGTNGSTGTLTANFTAKTYSVTLNDDHGGSNNGSATATYDATTIDVSSDATFSGWTLLGYWNTDGNMVTDASGNVQANVAYYSDASNHWHYDNDVTLYAHWSRSVTLDDNGGSDDGSVTVTYKGTAATPSTPVRTGYHVEAYYAEEGCTHKVMETDGTLVNYSGYVTDGKWTKTDATTLYAKWEPNTYTVTLHNDHGGESSDDGTATATYDATSLSSITHAQFEGWNLLGYWNSSAVQVADANGNLKASVDGFTDGSAKWTKTANADVWAHWSRTITLDDNVAQRHNGSVSVTYKGSAASYSAPASREGYTLAGYYDDAAGTNKVMNANGTLVSDVSGYTDGSGNWTHKTAATLYAKWTSDHFIIYRSGDKDDDPRKLGTDVESYAGGTLDKTIEFRMKVRDLDMWYTLCLPFTVSAVKVWDEVDGPAYYDIVPYYRSSGTFYTGHYIIRTPEKTTDLSIAEFGKWNDPESPTGYKPSKDTPYIIQWHDSYFLGKYISFFGAADQTIPSFSAGSAPSSDNVVNVCVNNSMTTGSVAGAYMLESDYGNGAWLRLDNADESRPIPPFECYLLVNNPTRARYMAIRPGMTVADTPTGWDDVVNSETKTHIVVYSISGICVTQYNDCSINEAGQRLSESYGEGLYILRTDNESVKLMVGGK